MRGIFKRAVVLGLVLALMLSACAAALAVDPPKTDSQLPAVVPLFPDVKAADGNAVFINYAAKRDLIKGFPDGGFHPAEALTRAQAAVLLVKAGGIKTGTKQTTTFKDVPASHWAFASIAAASEAGYLKGFPDGTFKPEQKLSRAQGISLFLRLSKQRMDQAELPALLDMSKDHWAAPSVATALEAKMIGLSSDKKNFYPDADLSRGDLARALAILLTKDPGLYQTPLSPSLSVKSGDVKIGSANASGAAVLKTGDIIDTGDKGEAEITFPDGSGLLLKSNTILVIKESKGRAYIKADGNPGTAVESLNVELKQGKIFGALASRINANPETARADDLRGKISSLVASLGDRLARMLAANDKEAPWYKTAEQKKVKVKVDMPWGIAAIRGSFWSNTVSSSSCSTSLLEGDASMTAGGGSQSLAPGQASTVGSAGGTPSVPTVMSASEKSAWAQEKGWVQSRAEAIQNNQESIQTQIAPGEKAAIPSTSIVETVNQALSQAQTGAVPTTPASGGTGGGGSYTPYVSISGLSDVSMSVYSATYQTVSFTTSPTADVVTAVYGTPGIVCLGTPTINSLDIYPITAGKTTVTITASKTGYTNGSGTFNVTVYNPLGQVTGVAWQPSPNCRKISWNTVPNASGYLVKLLKGAAVVYQTTVASSSWEADFTTQINNDIIANGAGAYTAKVTAVGSMTAPDYYGNGPESAASSPRSFLAQVGTPTWTSSNQISWNDVSNATCYTASLYQDGGTTAIETQNISPGVQTCTFAGVSTGHTYTATVQAVGDGTSYFDGPISAQSGAKTLLGQVTGLSWSGTNLNWTALTTAPSSYEVKLYKVGTPDTLSGTFSTSGTTKDLSSSLTVPGEYYATVQAKGNGSDMSMVKFQLLLPILLF
ncbi:S-layer homology domain-containing protein [Syntrophomonas palmitatica]|uniref:S-layer homology domain-containing protein n=1 Tax=Syntrophomonas palmitatica TaxID=402877 RepID=UPI0006D24F85|nr:S-layer homology domain-containing protein [Syntrophomonas palmitatica]